MGARPGTNLTVDDLDYIGRPREERHDSWGTAEVLTEYKDRIAIGQPMDGISELGHLHRQLLQETDFHAVGRTLLKKLCEEEKAERFGFDGRELPDKLKATLLTLEEFGVNTSTLKSTILLAEGNTETIDWITENWITFVDANLSDALDNAEPSLLDCQDTKDFTSLSEEKTNFGAGPSRDSYKVVEVFQKSIFKEAYERRRLHLRERIHDIQKCYTPQQVEQQLWSIRGAYEEDRQLLEHWSPKRKAEDRALYLSLLHRRREKIERQIEEGLNKEPMDFESIRRRMWFCFDREREEKIVEDATRPLRKDWMRCVDPKTGKVKDEGFMTEEECQELINKGKPDPRKFIKEKVFTSPSIWEIEKSRAFCELNHTRKQWGKIYDYIWEKMSDTIISRLKTMRTADEGVQLAEYIRRFQFRLNADQLGEVILEKASKVKTYKGSNLIRLLLASCQYQLDKEVKQAIVKELTKRRF